MQWIAALALVLPLLAFSAPAEAQSSSAHRTVATTSWIEEWDPVSQRWVRVDEDYKPPTTLARKSSTARYALPFQEPVLAEAIAQYGPFLVVDATRVVMIGSTNTASPQHFDVMMRDFPNLRILEMVEAPGTTNDIANLALGRRIRAAGLATHVPQGGSVRSGAVEIFLAGSSRSIAPGAHFAVHAWLDNYGREPGDFAPDDYANRIYIDYYVEMGMSEARAKAFYAMTNSVPHASAKWLRADEMREWIAPHTARARSIAPKTFAVDPAGSKVALLALPISGARPSLAYGDIGAMTLAMSVPAASYACLDSQRAFP